MPSVSLYALKEPGVLNIQYTSYIFQDTFCDFNLYELQTSTSKQKRWSYVNFEAKNEPRIMPL